MTIFPDTQFQPSTQLPARGTINSIPKKITTSPADGRQPFKFPSQSAASSHANHPASNDSISQDSAFPPFPTSKSRSTTPTIPSDITQSFASYNLGHQNQRDSNSSFAPLSPRDNGGGSVLQRMNSIVPGPFNLSSGNTQPSGHKKTATMGSSKDFIYQPSVEAGKRNVARPSTAGSNNSRKPSLSSISGGPRSTVSRGKPDTPDETLHQGRFHTVEIIDGESVIKTAQEETRIEALRREDRSHTYPLDFPDQTRSVQSRPEALRRPSAPSLHVTRPSVAAAIRPLHEIGSVSSFKPSRSIRERTRSPVKATTGEPLSRTKFGDELLAGTKPKHASILPASIYAESYAVGNPHHTPGESISSNDSSGSNGKSGSSNSTPPLSGSPQRQKRRPSNLSQGGNLMQEFQFGLEDKLAFSASFNSSTGLAATDPSITTKAGTLAPGSMNDPAIHSGRPSPVTTPDGSFDPFPLESDKLLHSPAPPSPQKTSTSLRKPTKANKGRCRGCGELIIGKSVSSADGRLTGRYHKRRFVSQTCQAPFSTADLYILENHTTRSAPTATKASKAPTSKPTRTGNSTRPASSARYEKPRNENGC